MRKMYSIICLLLVLLMSGCNKKTDIEINLDDYRPLENYYFQEHNDFLMRKGNEEIDMIGGIYTLKGLSPEAYVGHVQCYFNISPPSKTLYAHRDVDEPIISLDPYRVVLSVGDKKLTIKKKAVVAQLVNVRRNKGVQISEHPTCSGNMCFLFDVSCELEWDCHMLIEGKNIKMLWYTGEYESEELYICDITDILQEHSLLEEVYSLIEKEQQE